MALDTYANLKTAVGDFLNREDLTSAIGDFIALAEAQMQREIRHWRMEKRATATVSDRYTALPSDFHEPVSLYIDGANPSLQPIPQHQMQDKRSSTADATGVPRFYCITAGEIELYPTPSSGTLELYYLAQIPSLSATNASNWLLEEAPDAYLYGALLQSAPYLMDDERLAVWSGLYLAAITALNKQSKMAKWGGQGLKMRSRNG